MVVVTISESDGKGDGVVMVMAIQATKKTNATQNKTKRRTSKHYQIQTRQDKANQRPKTNITPQYANGT